MGNTNYLASPVALSAIMLQDPRAIAALGFINPSVVEQLTLCNCE